MNSKWKRGEYSHLLGSIASDGHQDSVRERLIYDLAEIGGDPKLFEHTYRCGFSHTMLKHCGWSSIKQLRSWATLRGYAVPKVFHRRAMGVDVASGQDNSITSVYVQVRKVALIERDGKPPYYLIKTNAMPISAFNTAEFERYGIREGDVLDCKVKRQRRPSGTYYNLVSIEMKGKEAHPIASKEFVADKLNELRIAVYSRQWELAQSQGDVEAEKLALANLSRIL